MRRVAAILAVALALASCAQMPRKIEAQEKSRDLLARCEALREAGRLKTHVEVVDCALQRVIDTWTAAGYPFMDLVYVWIQARRNGADRIDRGQATEAEVERQLAQLDARIDDEEKRRQDLISRGANPAPVAPETLVVGLDTLSPRPIAKPRQPEGNCVSIGPFRQCN
ncbi:MAG TPA: hypothetical protein VN802_11390 [Stellaceae bacterium]|nr:hypothetical protein [Stellaceae bacterium]